MKHTRNRLLIILVGLMLVTAACSSRDTSETTSLASPEALSVDQGLDQASAGTAEEALQRTEAPASEDALAPDSPVEGAFAAQDLGRSIIFQASMLLAVTDVGESTTEAIRLMEQQGGVLFGQQTVGVPEPASTLTFRIAPAGFQAALDALAGLGELRSQNVSADDVTERVVDLESRIATAEVSVERLRALIEEAQDLKTITDLENQLLERETLLETLRGQLRTIRGQVDLATITVTLTEALSRPEVLLQVSAYPGTDDNGASCPGESQLSIEENTMATVCFEITNTGDTPLTEFEVRDPVLDLEMADLVTVFGDPAATLEPGEFLILAAGIDVERTLRSQSRVTATPVNADGTQLEDRQVSNTTSALIQAVDPGGLPGFDDGVSTSWDLLLGARDLIVLLVGLAIPFLWIPVAIWLYVRWRKARNAPPAIPVSAQKPSMDSDSDAPTKAS